MNNGIEVLNFGSLNIDHVYHVSHFVRPQETLAAGGYRKFAGGKGLNQSVALARAGLRVAHAGKCGTDGAFLADTLREAGVDVRFLLRSEGPTGHACIQVDSSGQNAILVAPGANQEITGREVDETLAGIPPGTLLLLQNEINDIPLLMRNAARKGLRIALNPAPCGPEVADYPLELCDFLFVNEVEAAQLTGPAVSDPGLLLDGLVRRCPRAEVILTLGADGAWCASEGRRFYREAFPVRVVDTTCAGDTFIGYFLAARLHGASVETAMRTASRAGAMTVSRAGAAVSIPALAEVMAES